LADVSDQTLKILADPASATPQLLWSAGADDLVTFPGGGSAATPAVAGGVDESIDESGQFSGERVALFFGNRFHFGKRIGQTVRNLHVLAAKFAEKFHVVVAGHTEGIARGNHVPHKTERIDDSRTTVDEVANEDRLAAFWMGVVDARPARARFFHRLALVAKLNKQFFQLVAASVHVTDEIERAVLVSLVVPKGRPLDGGGVDLLRRLHHENVPEALTLQSLDGTT
jgi:hypothetical protein